MPAVREGFVKVQHKDTEGVGEVSLAALPHYKKQGWEVVEEKELKAVQEAVEKGEDPEAARQQLEAGETDNGSSKRTARKSAN